MYNPICLANGLYIYDCGLIQCTISSHIMQTLNMTDEMLVNIYIIPSNFQGNMSAINEHKYDQFAVLIYTQQVSF